MGNRCCHWLGGCTAQGSVPQLLQRVCLEREGEQNPFGLALFNPWPERGAVELGNEDKESKMFHQMF